MNGTNNIRVEMHGKGSAPGKSATHNKAGK